MYTYSNYNDTVMAAGRQMLRIEYYNELIATGQSVDWATLQTLRLARVELPKPEQPEK